VPVFKPSKELRALVAGLEVGDNSAADLSEAG
jgi:hypothetical protein